nr:uncharacterized protein LOC123497252 [Aegilops tauschii subsp. strangulata]
MASKLDLSPTDGVPEDSPLPASSDDRVAIGSTSGPGRSTAADHGALLPPAEGSLPDITKAIQVGAAIMNGEDGITSVHDAAGGGFSGGHQAGAATTRPGGLTTRARRPVT